MDVTAEARLVSPPDAVHAALADLATYPAWLAIVGRAWPAEAHADDAGPAWNVELVGRLGPLARTKRVRMVLVGADAGAGTVRFERAERDGRSHHEWVLTASVSGESRVEVRLHYSGPMVPGADLLLRRDIAGAGRRLDLFVSGGG